MDADDDDDWSVMRGVRPAWHDSSSRRGKVIPFRRQELVPVSLARWTLVGIFTGAGWTLGSILMGKTALYLVQVLRLLVE